MKKPLFTSLSLIVAVSSVSAQTVWTGAGSDSNINNASNWDNGLPTGGTQGTINAGTVTVNLFNLADYDVVQNGGTATDANGGLGTAGNPTTWLINGGIFDASNTGNFEVNHGSSLTNAGGDLNIAGKLRLGNSAAATFTTSSGTTDADTMEINNGSTATFSGGTTTLTGNLSFVATGGNASFTGGTFSADQLSIVDGSSITIGGNAGLTFSNSAVGGGGLGPTGTSTIDFLTSSASLTITGGPSIAYSTMWDNDRLLLDGQSKTDLGGLAFNLTPFIVSGTGDETLTVPEPSTYALIAGCMALAGIMIRRRRS